METPPTGDKRSLSFTFANEQLEENKAKKQRTDEGPTEASSAPSLKANSADAMEIDDNGPVPKAVESEYSKRFRSLEQRELQLTRELTMLKNGTHPSLADVMMRLERERVEKYAACEHWRQYQLRQVEVEFEARKKQAEDEYLNDQRELKEKLIDKIKEEKRKLDEEFALNDDDLFLADTNDRPRRISRRRNVEELGLDYERSSAMLDLEKRLVLQEKEIREDLMYINRAVQQMST